MDNQEPKQTFWSDFRARFRRFRQRYQLIRWLIVIVLTMMLLMSGYLTFKAKTANVGDLKAALENPTKIYDRKNNKAGTLYSQKGTYVPLTKISTHVQDAVISTEDRNFYHEHGFSVKGIGRALLLYAKNKILRQNYISGGGSTLTQQLVKNAYLTQEQTFTRKFKELFLSIEVENVYTKQDILSMYLNNAYFGNGVWGVQDAAERYFGTTAANLTVPQSAVLAGMLTSPNTYNPIDHPQASRSRRNVVLGLMGENNKLTSGQVSQYQATALTTSDNYTYKNSYKYPYFFDAVINEAINKYGLTESEIMNKGYKIYTTLDQGNQQQMQTLFKNPSYFPANASDGTKVQAASIAIDPNTGGVEAVVGGRGKHAFRGYNRATQMRRQPGSTIKPLAVYTPALENGYYYDSELTDKKKSYGTNHYSPHNYGNQYSGKVPMYQALAQSKNAPAVWLLNKIGVDKGYESVKKFGLPVTKSDKNLALALGGLKTGVSPQQLGQAYTAYANNGTMSSAHYIRKIVDASGNVVVDTQDSAAKTKQVMSSKTAKQMTSMMMGVFNYGTGTSAKPYGYTIAGKTGSTEADGDNDATRDKWIVGYTPDIVVTTWEGFDNTSSAHHLEDVSGTGEGPLYQAEMQGILPNTKGTSFDTKDASTIANGENNAAGSGSTDVWDQVQKGINNAGKQFDNAADQVKDWWEKAKSWVN
ncbi:membrane carboxypeptidase (penicillin-binding protein) [Levilactobacillus senmaizukei DSM 21775 = NBRC 103853]|uniref:Membrane carboxypeptidase (Penicillin-binding protein) n=1 Tax=Levilactobacillus senmaizukei DSM 21775 = NBRC 103853 TaxID=1423803 RepID=A0A0R2DDU2_9LACO|nr:PBP1A family penicillin-binding protein [Levilactobacillus senmaizukei]KRN02110.1 membrane carboxypeptidase (penicillin-binding protein) [Levilactobacillus senmaizukei DSM 21775 = NBRC 103853]